jgi:hypothetical protein
MLVAIATEIVAEDSTVEIAAATVAERYGVKTALVRDARPVVLLTVQKRVVDQ